MKKLLLLLLFFLSFCHFSYSQKAKKIHHTIFEFDFTCNLYQKAQNNQSEKVDVINKVDNFIGFRYVNSFFIKEDLSIGLGIGLEIAPVAEFPIVLDIRKYFKTNYVVFNIGKTYSGYNEFGTFLGEIGFGKKLKISKKLNMNLSVNYQLTYLDSGEVYDTNPYQRWVKDFYTHTLAFKIGIIL